MDCDRIALRNYIEGMLEDDEERLEFLLHADTCRCCRDAVFEARKNQDWERKYKTKKPTQENDVTKREQVIEYVRNNPGQTSAQIGQALQLSPSSATGQLSELTHREVLTRTRNEQGLYCYRHADAKSGTDTAPDTAAFKQQQAATLKTPPTVVDGGHPQPNSSHKVVIGEMEYDEHVPCPGPVFKANGKPMSVRELSPAPVGTADWDDEIIALGEMNAYLEGVRDKAAKKRILAYLAEKHGVAA